MTTQFETFSGAKIALIEGSRVLTYLRDDKRSIPFPGCWDLAGGGRENGESPERCALRETEEEFGLNIAAARIIWRQQCQGLVDPTERSYFLAARITKAEVSAVRFGEEGQYWQMMEIDEFLSHPKAVPQLQDRLAHFLSVKGGCLIAFKPVASWPRRPPS